MRRPKSRSTTFRHKPELMKKVDVLAKRSSISRNKLIELVLGHYVDTKTPADLRDMALADAEQEMAHAGPALFD